MTDDITFATYALLREVNGREFRRKLDLFPEELRYYVILANSIIGAANAKRVKETPHAVAQDGEEFVSKLLSMINPEKDEKFREVLETYLIETMKDELRFCCANCALFSECAGLGHTSLGALFKRQVQGEDTPALKKEISREVEKALEKTPYLDSEEADGLCKNFSHQYRSSALGEFFGRYSDIAAELRNSYGIDYRKIQREMVALNLAFCEKGK